MTVTPIACSRPGIVFPVALALIFLFVAASPASTQGFSVAYGNLDFVVLPGDRIAATFSVTNLSEETKVLRVYSGDWVRVQGDTPDYAFDEEGGNEVRSLLKWMTFSPDQMDLAPGEMRDVYCEVNFPDDPTLEGSYWGVVFVEEIPPPEPGVEAPRDEGMHVGISTIFRYAVKIFATFQYAEVLDASFTDLLIQQVEGGFDVTAVFENKGNIYMRPQTWLEIRDSTGEVIYRQDYVRQTVLPESSRNYAFELRDLSLGPGTYLVMVISDYGAPKLVAAQGIMELKAEETPPAD